MGEYIPPSAFYTFDPIKNDPITLIEPILSSIGGDHADIKKICLLYTSPSPRD